MDKVVVNLPSLVRKFGSQSENKTLCEKFGCKLNRVGRSRNWMLSGGLDGLLQCRVALEQSNEPSHLWIANRIALLPLDKQEIKRYHFYTANMGNTKESKLATALALELELNPSIAISELMNVTGATSAQAREAMDKFEGF